MTILVVLRRAKRGLIIVLPPILLMPLPAAIQTSEAYAAYILILMAIYWVTEVIPLGVTSLIPMVLTPMFMISPTSKICMHYMSDTNVLFFGGLMIALAVEKWHLHERIALGAMLLIGTSYRRLMLGFMLTAWFLSMWISNTATTAMMIPIVDAVLKQLKETISAKREKIEMSDKGHSNPIAGNEIELQDMESQSTKEDNDTVFLSLAKCYCTCVAYAASCGGIGTLTGTGPNLVLNNEISKEYGDKTMFGFGTWMVYAIPISFVALMVVWVWLQLWFLGFKNFFICKSNKEEEAAVKRIIQKNYRDLGPVSFAEGSCICFFAMVVLLWISRNPGVPGWSILFKKPGEKPYVKDAQPPILIAILMFMWPSKNPFAKFMRKKENISGSEDKKQKSSTILAWKDMLKFPWEISLLLGGSFALAETCKASGLSAWVGEQLQFLSAVPKPALVLLVTTGSAFFTEFTSNTATATILMPILNKLAVCINAHPFVLMLPAAVGCSLAFCLPVATPPNAIVFAKGYLTVLDMMKVGVFLNIICVLIVTGGTLSYGTALFNMYSLPDWAGKCSSNTTIAR